MATSSYKYPKSLRLLKSSEFRHFIKKGKKVSNPDFLISAKPNHFAFPRLGLVVSKKCSKKAVERNRIKRVIRESFRYHQHLLKGLDCLVVTRKSVLERSKAEFRAELDRLWQRLSKLFKS